jgi:hypothetical protein
MFETLFGAEMPLATRFFLAFVVLLFLVGVVAFLARSSLLRLTASRAASEGAKDIERSISELVHKTYDHHEMEGAAANSALAEQLTKLATLHADGALTDEEFHAFKASLLASATNSQISPYPQDSLRQNKQTKTSGVEKLFKQSPIFAWGGVLLAIIIGIVGGIAFIRWPEVAMDHNMAMAPAQVDPAVQQDNSSWSQYYRDHPAPPAPSNQGPGMVVTNRQGSELLGEGVVMLIIAGLCFGGVFYSLVGSLIRDAINTRMYYAVLSIVMFAGLIFLGLFEVIVLMTMIDGSELLGAGAVVLIIANLCFVGTCWSLVSSLIRDPMNTRMYYAVLSIVMFAGLIFLGLFEVMGLVSLGQFPFRIFLKP